VCFDTVSANHSIPSNVSSCSSNSIARLLSFRLIDDREYLTNKFPNGYEGYEESKQHRDREFSDEIDEIDEA
jgi:hypothetical protein